MEQRENSWLLSSPHIKEDVFDGRQASTLNRARKRKMAMTTVSVSQTLQPINAGHNRQLAHDETVPDSEK